MARSLDQACQRYALALRQGRMNMRRDGDADDQVEQYRQALELERCIEVRTREVLNDCGVARIDRLAYFNFSRRIARLTRRFESRTLENETRNAVAQWLLQGAQHKVLLTICREVFSLNLE